MTDIERRAEIRKILEKSGWGERKDEKGRMIRIFEKNAFYEPPSTDNYLLDATTTREEKFGDDPIVGYDDDLFDIQPPVLPKSSFEK